MKNLFKLLYLESSAEDVAQVEAALKREYLPCEVVWVNTREAFASALRDGWGYDLILAAWAGPGLSGKEALALASQAQPMTPCVLLTDRQSEAEALAALHLGAAECVAKDPLTRLGPVLRQALAGVREIEARRRAEDANGRLAALLRLTLESTADGILVVDLAGKITTYNRKFMALYGIPDYVLAPMELDRVLQFLLDQFTDPEAFLQEIRHLLRQPERDSRTYLNTRDERILEQTSRPFLVAKQTVGRLFSFRDVTDRERAIEELEAKAAKDQELLKAVAAAGAVPWTLSDGRLRFGEAVEVLLGPGRAPQDLPGLEALLHPEDLPGFRHALDQPERAFLQARWRGAEQSWRWVHWQLQRVASGRWHGLCLDISAARQQSEEREVQLRLEWTTILAENLAQALRGPLQALGEALVDLRAGTAPAPALDRATQAVAQFEDLLAQAALATRCPPTANVMLDLNDLVERLRPWAERTLGPGIRLLIQPGPQVPALPLNPVRLEPVVMNLILNARDALNGSGEVRVRTGSGPGPDGVPAVWLEVQDDGFGVSPRVRSRMFEPFFTTKDKDHGLGLSVVRSIVESYGGSIQVQSGQGAGTCMRVLLPTLRLNPAHV